MEQLPILQNSQRSNVSATRALNVAQAVRERYSAASQQPAAELCCPVNYNAAYLQALARLNLSDVSRETGRAYRTLQAYRRGELQPSAAAVSELIAYLRAQTKSSTHAADKLTAAQRREGEDA